ncbi:MAG: cell division ATPase MinD [Candidatus Aenigmatarchaeota archaeon]
MTRIIACVSGKGGAGKTTIAANLGAALTEFGKDVVVLDANLTTPNLGLHLGVPLYPTTLHDVLKGKAKIQDAIYEHSSGLKIIPAGIALKDLKGVDVRGLSSAILDLLGNVDIVIIDAAAGLGREALAAMECADELLLITNPELTAVTDALKAAKLAEQMGTKISGVVVNRVTGRKHELNRRDILRLLGDVELLAEVPEDVAVQEAIAIRTPIVHHKPSSISSREIRNLASRLIGREVKAEIWYRKFFPFIR